MTTSAVVYAFLFIHLGVILVATAYFVLGAAMAPAITARARTRFARRPWLPIIVGGAVSLPWVIVALVLLNGAAAPLKLAGAVIGGIWIMLALLGGAGVAQHVGRGCVDGGAVSWAQTARGGLFISLTWVLPVVGWLGMLPLTLSAGIGCLLLGLIPARSSATSVAVT